MWLAATAVAILLTPVGAFAARDDSSPIKFTKQGGFGATMHLQGSHGFELTVSAIGHHRVMLRASKGSVDATYIAPGSASRKGIEARFGEVGRISVRFQGSRLQSRDRQGSRVSCKGPRPIQERGIYRGSIVFDGEHGFTAVDRGWARGEFTRSFRQACERERGPGRGSVQGFGLGDKGDGASDPRIHMSIISVKSGPPQNLLSFGVVSSEMDLGPKADEALLVSVMVATLSEKRGPLRIERQALIIGEEDSLLSSKPGAYPLEATVTLPKPFSGTATYRQDRGAEPSWSGDLGVWLPGAETVSLAPPGSRAIFCQGTIRELTTCAKRKSSSKVRPDAARLLMAHARAASAP